MNEAKTYGREAMLLTTIVPSSTTEASEQTPSDWKSTFIYFFWLFYCCTYLGLCVPLESYNLLYTFASLPLRFCPALPALVTQVRPALPPSPRQAHICLFSPLIHFAFLFHLTYYCQKKPSPISVYEYRHFCNQYSVLM